MIRRGRRSGAHDLTYVTTPWRQRDSDGLWVGHRSGEVWLYRELDVHPFVWEDPHTRLSIGSPLASLLYDLAATSKDFGGGLRTLARSRQIHLLSVTWEEQGRPPEGTHPGLQPLLTELMNYMFSHKAVVIGVKLWPATLGASGVSGIKDLLRRRADQLLGEDVFDERPYADDRRQVTEILRRNGAHRPPRDQVKQQMESWYNRGVTPDATLVEGKDHILTTDGERLEFAAVTSFDSVVMRAPEDAWVMAAQMSPSPARVVSIRGQLEPSTVARARVRKSQRRIIDQIEQQNLTGDLDRPEDRQALADAQQVEQFILSGREPLISSCSILMARVAEPSTAESYIDELRNVFGIEMKPLEHRQIAALEETLPTGVTRVNPFLQDVSVGMLAYAGLQAHSRLGDDRGVFVGLVDPDMSPCLTNPLAAPAREKPPSALIAGDPGSGKTMLMQLMAAQMALSGLRVVFINPKSDDSLDGLLNVIGSGTRIGLSELQQQGGFFDPFRFTAPTVEGRHIAADIAAGHILTVLGSRGVAGLGFTQEQEITLIAGLRTAADAGVQCVAQALEHVSDDFVRDQVLKQASDPLFRLGIAGLDGAIPEPYHGERGLLLIEFDRPLDIPEKGVTPSEYTRTNRLALAAVRLVTRASLEMLAGADGGGLFVDEAWMFLQSSEGLAALQSLGRLGRSKNIFPVFATQRVDDLIQTGVDMEGYLSRVWALKLNDEREARAALRLCKLEATPQRIEWLRQAGTRRDENGRIIRGAMGLHRDLDERHSAVLVGPIPEWLRMELSTNPGDRQTRRQAQR